MRQRRGRRWRPLLLVGVLMSAALAACTPPGLPAPLAPSVAVSGSTGAVLPVTLTVGLDSVPVGFNPHTVADGGATTTAIASLVLPSAFTPGPDGVLQRNAELLDSAEVTATAPFTVTYRLNVAAAWSDGTPITAEDFTYLRGQMLIRPGTVDPAGYRLISAIDSRDAGKTVVVTFSTPFPEWTHLFDNLLPSHIMKDSPGGWDTGLDNGLPVSGSRYKFANYDVTNGEISLIRNDKYWRNQPGPAKVVVRIGSDVSLLDAFARGSVQAMFLVPGAADAVTLAAEVPALRRTEVTLPATVQLLFDTTDGPLADVRVRQAVAAALDTNGLRTALSGGRAGVFRPVDSLTALPGPAAVADPATDRPARARSILEAAGWTRAGLYYGRDGVPLRLTLRYPAGRTDLEAAARLAARQLGTAGIEVDLVRIDIRDLVAARFARAAGGMSLLAVPRGSSDAIAAASAFACGSAAAPPGTPAGSTGPSAVTGPATAASSAGAGASAGPVPGNADIDRGSANLSGYCAADLQPDLAATLTSGTVPATLDERLSAAVPLLPVAQPTAVFAVAPTLASVLDEASPGWAFSGPLIGVPGWPVP